MQELVLRILILTRYKAPLILILILLVIVMVKVMVIDLLYHMHVARKTLQKPQNQFPGHMIHTGKTMIEGLQQLYGLGEGMERPVTARGETQGEKTRT